MTPEEKERIDYEINAKKEAREKEVNGCLYDFLFAFWIVVIFSAIVNSCINS